MRPLLKRIAVNGLLTAGVLAVVGLGLAELARLWLVSQAPGRAVPVAAAAAPAADPMAGTLRTRVPLVMAAWGFAFVALGEAGLYLVRGNPKPAAAKKPADLTPDPAEVLLEELLRQAEAAQAQAEPAPAARAAHAHRLAGTGPSRDNTPVQHPATPG
jgi:hypothetical protein